MAVVTKDFLAGIRTQFRALFLNTFHAASKQQPWQSLVMRQDSEGESNTYTWFGTTPRMRARHGQAEFSGLSKFSYVITNVEYQGGIEVHKRALERDQLGMIAPRIRQLGLEAARHPGELVFELFENPGNAFDGAAFFANTRVIGESANIDNNAAGTGTTVAQLQTDLQTNRSTMRRFQDDRGRPGNLLPSQIVVPPELEQLMWQALNTIQGGGGDTPVIPASTNGNISASGYDMVVNPYLTDVDDWYLLHNGSEDEKPFLLQTEQAAQLLSDTDPESRTAIEQGTFVHSVEGSYAVGVGDPRMAIKITN